MRSPFARVVITGLALLLGMGRAEAQELVLRTLDEERGLPTNCVLDMYIDREGLVWLGTNKGLYRYDGFTYERIGAGTPLDEFNVVRIREFPELDLFVLAAYGNRLFTYAQGTVREIELPRTAYQLGDGGSFNGLVLDGAQRLHVALSETHGQFIIDLRTGSAVWESDEQANTAGRVERLAGGLFYRITKPGEVSGTTGPDTIHMAEGPPLVVDAGDRAKARMGAFGAGDLRSGGWYVHYRNLLQVHHGNEHYRIVLNNRILGLTEDRSGRLWVRTWADGLHCLDQQLRPIALNAPPLQNTHVTSCVEDAQGGLWFSTVDRGIFYCADPNVHCFKAREHFRTPWISCLSTLPNGSIAAGTANGQVFVIDPREAFKMVLGPDDLDGTMELKGLPLSGDSLLFPGRFDLAMDLRTGRTFKYPDRFPRWTNLYGIAALNEKRYLLATLSGIRFADLDRPGTNTEILPGKRCYNITPNRHQGRYWAATHLGLYAGDERGFVAVDSADALVHGRAYDLLWHGDSLWLATQHGLVLRYHGQNRRIKLSSGPSDHQVRAFALHQDRWLFAATFEGLFIIDLRDPAAPIKRFGRPQGTPSDVITDVALSGDRVWLIAGSDLCTFHLSELDQTSPRLPLRILGVGLPGRPPEAGAPVYDHSVQHVVVHLRDLNFARFRGPAFRYRSDTSSVWSLSERPVLDLIGLKPGHYRLEAQAAAADGTWGPSAYTEWTIRPAFWQTYLFRASSVFILIALVSSFLIYYRNRKLREQLLASQVERYHHKALLAQMEPHFLYNALNSIQGYVAGNDVEASSRYVSRFAKLMRGILNAAHNELITLEEEIAMLENYCALEAVRTEPPLSYAITQSADLLPSSMLIPSFLVQPYVENAIRHGLRNLNGERTPHLAIRFEPEGLGAIRCTVEDNGVGRKVASSITAKGEGWRSLGTRINEERLPLLSRSDRSGTFTIDTQDLYDAEGRSAGTRVVIILPIKYQLNE